MSWTEVKRNLQRFKQMTEHLFLTAGRSSRPDKWELSYLAHGVNPIWREEMKEEKSFNQK